MTENESLKSDLEIAEDRIAEVESFAYEWERSCKIQKGRAEAAEKRADMFADLCRGVAEVIGVPTEGEGSSWHDLPEKVKAKIAPAPAAPDALREKVNAFIDGAEFAINKIEAGDAFERNWAYIEACNLYNYGNRLSPEGR